MSRLLALVAALAVIATACTNTDSGRDVSAENDEGTPSALFDPTAPGLPEPLVDPSRIISGGPPPDGIPPIDDPQLIGVGEVDFLQPREPVLSLELAGQARAYPVQIMTWHEIVNDRVGDVPVTVSYCPLCNSAIAYDRRVDGEVLDFGTSGKLYKSALVMYDRQTESLWSHFTAQAIAGVMTGTELEEFAVTTVAWADWKAAHPDGLVLSRQTGFTRDYGRNPYPGYDDVDSNPFLFDGEVDGRLAAKERVVGVEVGDDTVAIRNDALLERGVIEATVGDQPIVAFKIDGTASALDDDEVAEGSEVGATGVFDPTLDNRLLTFQRDGRHFVDRQTGSSWDIFGKAFEGQLKGSRLEQISHVDTFWFAWASFLPDTTILP